MGIVLCLTIGAGTDDGGNCLGGSAIGHDSGRGDSAGRLGMGERAAAARIPANHITYRQRNGERLEYFLLLFRQGAKNAMPTDEC